MEIVRESKNMAIHSVASCFKNVSFHHQTSGPYRFPAASLSRPSTVAKASAFSSLAPVAFPRCKLQGTTTTLLHHGILSVANAVSYHRFCFPCGKKKRKARRENGQVEMVSCYIVDSLCSFSLHN